MTEQYIKEAYCAIEPSEALKGRVLAACRAAKKKRSAMRRRVMSAAACFAVVMVLSVYGLSPMPGISAGGEMMQGDAVAVCAEAIVVADLQQRNVSAYQLQTVGTGETVEGCVALSFDQKVTVDASEGILYVFEADSGTAFAVEMPYQAEANEQLYWCAESENAALKIRSGVRTVHLNLTRSADGWMLTKE